MALGPKQARSQWTTCSHDGSAQYYRAGGSNLLRVVRYYVHLVPCGLLCLPYTLEHKTIEDRHCTCSLVHARPHAVQSCQGMAVLFTSMVLMWGVPGLTGGPCICGSPAAVPPGTALTLKLMCCQVTLLDAAPRTHFQDVFGSLTTSSCFGS